MINELIHNAELDIKADAVYDEIGVKIFRIEFRKMFAEIHGLISELKKERREALEDLEEEKEVSDLLEKAFNTSEVSLAEARAERDHFRIKADDIAEDLRQERERAGSAEHWAESMQAQKFDLDDKLTRAREAIDKVRALAMEFEYVADEDLHMALATYDQTKES